MNNWNWRRRRHEQAKRTGDARCRRCWKFIPRRLMEAHKAAEDAIDEGLGIVSNTHPCYAPPYGRKKP